MFLLGMPPYILYDEKNEKTAFLPLNMQKRRRSQEGIYAIC